MPLALGVNCCRRWCIAFCHTWLHTHATFNQGQAQYLLYNNTAMNIITCEHGVSSCRIHVHRPCAQLSVVYHLACTALYEQ